MTPNELPNLRRIHLVASDPLPSRVLSWPTLWEVHQGGKVRVYEVAKSYDFDPSFQFIAFYDIKAHRIGKAA
jgi:hypothetical protein